VFWFLNFIGYEITKSGVLCWCLQSFYVELRLFMFHVLRLVW